MLAHCLRRWCNIEPTLCECFVFAGSVLVAPYLIQLILAAIHAAQTSLALVDQRFVLEIQNTRYNGTYYSYTR